VRVFDVRSGFPVLIEEGVPNGVGDVKYSIAISAISEYELAADKLQSEMEGWFRDVG
jgi:hypothetical protein